METTDKKQEPPKWNELSTGVKIITVLLISALLFLFIVIVRACTSESLSDKPWSELNVDQKKEVLDKQTSSLDAQHVNVQIEEIIKKHFQYPETVKIKRKHAIISDARIVDAEEGRLFNSGEVIAKNGFGVPATHYYEVEMIYNGEWSLERVEVIE